MNFFKKRDLKSAAAVILAFSGLGPFHTLSAHGYPAPKFRTSIKVSDDQTSLLVYILEHIPDFLEESKRVEFEPAALFEAEDDLVRALKRSKNHRELWPSIRGPYLEFRVRSFNGPAPLAGSDGPQVSAQTAAFLNSLQGQDPKKALQILTRLSEVTSALSYKGSSASLLNALIQCLPKEAKTEAYRLSDSERLSFLEKNLAEQDFQSAFDPARLNMSAKPENVTRALELLRLTANNERSIQQASWTLFVNAVSKGAPLSPAAWAALLTSESAIKGLIEKLPAREGALVSRLLNFDSRNWIQKTKSSKEFENEFIRVSEVPPELAAYRGFVGGDCSTTNSFGYPYSPAERVFYIYDAQNRLRGYLGATIVFNEKEGLDLYIHDLSGRDLPVRALRAALFGVNQQKDRLGVKQIIIAAPDRLRNNMHNNLLIDALIAVSNQSIDLVPDRHLGDFKVREIIARHVESDQYDDPYNNNLAHPLIEDPEFSSTLRTEVARSTAKKYKKETYLAKLEKLRPIEAYALASRVFDIEREDINVQKTRGDWGLSQRILEPSGLEHKPWKKLEAYFTEPHPEFQIHPYLTYEKFLAQISRLLQDTPIKLSDFLEHPFWRQRISDAVMFKVSGFETRENKERYLPVVIREIESTLHRSGAMKAELRQSLFNWIQMYPEETLGKQEFYDLFFKSVYNPLRDGAGARARAFRLFLSPSLKAYLPKIMATLKEISARDPNQVSHYQEVEATFEARATAALLSGKEAFSEFAKTDTLGERGRNFFRNILSADFSEIWSEVMTEEIASKPAFVREVLNATTTGRDVTGIVKSMVKYPAFMENLKNKGTQLETQLLQTASTTKHVTPGLHTQVMVLQALRVTDFRLHKNTLEILNKIKTPKIRKHLAPLFAK